MSVPVRRRRLEMSTIGDIIVVSFVDKKILDEQNIQIIGEQLFDLVDKDGYRKMVLNFSNVEFISSAAWGKLLTLNRKIQVTRGRLVLCNLTREIYEVTEINKTNKWFLIVKSEDDALDAFSGRAIETTCPVHGCHSCVSSTAHLAFVAPDYHANWQQECPACNSTFWTTIKRLPGPEGTEGKVRRVTLPTYDGERINIFLENHWTGSSRWYGYRIEVAGRLDLLVSEVLLRACLSLPEPRRAILDFRTTTDLTAQGVDALGRMFPIEGESPLATILIDSNRASKLAQQVTALRVNSTAEEAIQALGHVSESSHSPIPVTVRAVHHGV